MHKNISTNFMNFLFSVSNAGGGNELNIDGHTIEYIVNQKGNLQLVIDGYQFYRSKSSTKKMYYTCVQEYTFG